MQFVIEINTTYQTLRNSLIALQNPFPTVQIASAVQTACDKFEILN
jgi:hypothetical protein